MPTVEESILIDRRREEVWAFLTQTDNIPAFESQTVRIKQVTEGAVGLGTRWVGASNVLGRTLEWTTEVVEFDPPRRSRMATTEAKFPFEISYTLAPSDGGTHFTYRIEAETGLGGFFGKLADPLVERAQARTVRTNLANLKELLEAGA